MATSVHDSLDVQHDADAHRFVLRHSGDTVGVLDYHERGDVIDMTHTEIYPQMRGRGLGAVLVRDALEELRQSHPQSRVRPSCWFVREFIDEHPEFADMLEV